LLSNSSKAPVAARVLGERLLQPLLAEIRPKTIDKVQLSVRALPQQEVAQAFLTARSDQEINIGSRPYGMTHLRQMLYKARLIHVGLEP
jgi:hypothetical protein